MDKNENVLGKMVEENEDRGERVNYSEFMRKGWYKGVTTDAEKSKHGGYDYIDVWVDVGVDVPDRANYDTVRMKFGLPVPKKLREEGELPPENLLSDFTKEVGVWNKNEDLKLDHFVGHKIRFPVIEKETENGTIMDIARKQDGRLSVESMK